MADLSFDDLIPAGGGGSGAQLSFDDLIPAAPAPVAPVPAAPVAAPAQGPENAGELGLGQPLDPRGDPIGPQPYGVMDGLTDPQQYKEAAKGILPGAASMVLGATPKGMAVLDPMQAIQANMQRYVADVRRVKQMTPAELSAFRQAVEKEPAAATRIAVQSAISDVLEMPDKYVDQYLADKFALPTPMAERPLFKLGEKGEEIAKGIAPAAPGYEQSIGRQLGEAGGSMAAGIPLSMINPAVAGTVFVTSQMGQGVDEAIKFDKKERAEGRPGLTQEQILLTGLLNAGPGATDIVPMETLLGNLPIPIPQSLKRPLAQAVARIGGQAFIEGIQEGGQQFLQNLIAKEVYDPNQPLTDQVAGNAGIGAGVGGIAETAKEIGSYFLGKLGKGARRGAHGTAPQPEAPTTESDATETPTEQTGTNQAQPAEQPENAGAQAALDDLDAILAGGEPTSQTTIEINGKKVKAPKVEAQPEASPDTKQRAADMLQESIAGLTPEDAKKAVDEAAEKPLEGEVLPPEKPGENLAMSQSIRTDSGIPTDTDMPTAKEAADLWAPGGVPRTKAEQIDAAAAETNTEPTEAQKEAGNYKKGLARWNGLELKIENGRGEERTSKADSPVKWSVTMPDHYGYVRRTEGADGDKVDMFMGRNPDSDKVWVINQRHLDGKGFDEHKAMLGYDDVGQATAAYDAAFSDGKGMDRIGSITEMSIPEFKDWVRDRDRTKEATHPIREDQPQQQAAPSPQDELYDKAVKIVRDTGNTSQSHLQRKLSLNFQQAKGLMDRMEAEGVVSKYDMDGKRTVLGAEAPKAAAGPRVMINKVGKDGLTDAEREAQARQAAKAVADSQQTARGKLPIEDDRERERQENVRKMRENGADWWAHPNLTVEGRKQAAKAAGMEGAGLEKLEWPQLSDAIKDRLLAARFSDKAAQERAAERAAQFESTPDNIRAAIAGHTSMQGGADAYLREAIKPGMSDKEVLAAVADSRAWGPAMGGYARAGKGVADTENRGSKLTLTVNAVSGPKKITIAGKELANHLRALYAQPTQPAPEPGSEGPQGVDNRELAQIVKEFRDAQAEMMEGGHPVSNIFQPPKKNEVVRLNDKVKVYTKDHGWMTPAEAKAKIAEWKEHAKAQADKTDNSSKVVLSLFDLSGEWSKPWEEAGYQVYRFDIQNDPEMGDVNNFSADFFGDWFGDFDGMDVYAILAANPCTDFASSGARHFAAKDKDGRTVASVKLVHQTLATIEYFKPAVWALENPVGRIEDLGGLPPWRLSFDPNAIGDPYTKKTLVWGRFNGDLPIAPVEPTEGSKMWAQYGGKSQATKNARSVTPEGFSYAFFMANNAHDHPAMAVANKYDRLDRSLIEKAIAAGVTPEQIDAAVEDHYYQDLNDAAANKAIRDLMTEAYEPGEAPQSTPAPAREDTVAVRKAGSDAYQAGDPRTAPDDVQAKLAWYGGYDTAKKAAEKKGTPEPKAKSEWTEIGKNAIGQTLYEDQRGVRSYIENGIRHTESVQISPRGEVNVGRRDRTWQTAEEHAPTWAEILNLVPGKPGEKDVQTIFREMADIAPGKRKYDELTTEQRQRLGDRLARMKEEAAAPKAEPKDDVQAALDAAMAESFPEEKKPEPKATPAIPEGFEIQSTSAQPASMQRKTGSKFVSIVRQNRTGSDNIARGYGNTPEEAQQDAIRQALEQAKALPPTDTRPAAEVAKSAATNLAQGTGDFIDGLMKAVGGNKLSMGVSFDEDTYKAAKPFFQQAIAHYKIAAHDIAELARRLVAEIKARGYNAEAIQKLMPYLHRFISDVRDGKVDLADAGKPTDIPAKESTNAGTGSTTARNPGVPEKPEGPGSERGDVGSDRGAGGAEDAGAAPERVSGARGEGGGPAGVPVRTPPAAAGGTGRGGSGKGAGVSRKPAQPAKPRRAGSDVSPEEAPTIPAANFRITPEMELGKGGEVAKFNDNITAIRIIRELDEQNRRATPEEQEKLARFVGWGGLANAFKRPDGSYADGWQKRAEELADLLTPAELAAARSSTRNAHYTSEPVVRGIWNAVQRLGFKGGLALELSSGTGNFIGMTPEALAGKTPFIAVEYDPITSKIAKALYPQATVLNAGLQQVPLPPGEALLNIGNPPFGNESLYFQYNDATRGHSIHNQFFIAGLDALAPGGLQALVVSRYLMDAQDSTARRALADRADLIGAIRLPETAFKENARTEVVTDIVFLRKKSVGEQLAWEKAKEQKGGPRYPSWVDATTIPDPAGGEPIHVNNYFAQKPDMILGKMDRTGSMNFGGDVTVKLPEGADIKTLLAQAVDKLPQNAVFAGDSVIKATQDRYKSMAEALELAVSGAEPGRITVGPGGRLDLVYERETPQGGSEMAVRTITPEAPWSNNLMMNAKGEWFSEEPKLDAKGNKVKEGSRIVYERKTYPGNKVPASMQLGKAKYDRLKGLVGLRDLVRTQLQLEAEDAAPAQMEANRKKLAAAYRAFVADNGFINLPANAGLIANMPDGALIAALESNYRAPVTEAKAKRTGDKATPATVQEAPILSRRVVPKYEPATQAQNPQDALAISLAERGRVDLERISGLLGMKPEQAAEVLTDGDNPLVYLDPETQTYQTANDYLSGQVAKKLKAAQAAGLSKNIKALEAAQPAPWTADQVQAQIGSSWVPREVYADFAKELVGAEQSAVRYSPLTNSYEVKLEGINKGKAAAFRTDEMPFEKIYEGMLNSKVPKVRDPGEDGKPGPINQEKSALVQLKAREIEGEFADWVFKDADRRAKLVKIFNDKFNTRVLRQYDGTHLTLPGKVPDAVIKMRRHQLNAIWRGVQERFLLVDHTVGAGKTFTAIARAMERRRMGLSRKPAIVVPNHLVGAWTADVYKLYPGAKVLAAGKDKFDKKNRRRLFAQIATGDWDIVIMPHSSFGKISISPEAEMRFLDHELAVATQAVKDAEEQAKEDGMNTGRGKPLNVKQAERVKATIEARLQKLKSKGRDNLLTFEQLGIDDLTVDEAHEFKNLFFNTRMAGEVRGLGNPAGSQKAFDLYNKVRVLRESPTGTVTFMTGTPVSNSAVELYTLMRYLAADQLQELGLEHFDAWRAQSVSAAPKFEPTEAGGLKEVSRLGRSWSNMRALMELYYSFTDAVSQRDIDRWYAEDNNGARFPIPRVVGGARQEVVVKPTPAQENILKDVIAGFNSLPGISDIKERNSLRLRLMDRARKVSLDARAVDRSLQTDEKGGKLDRAADEILRIYKKWDADAGTQLVFLDRSVPSSKADKPLIKRYDDWIARRDKARAEGDEEAYRAAIEELDKFDANEIDELRAAQAGGWNAYDQLKKNLIARGIPANEIRFIQEANTDLEKKALIDAVNDGRVRVLIGSTPRMGAGTNAQERLVALHHLDVTWKPSDIEQREGRIIRQGNKLYEKYGESFEVEIPTYVTERTVDAKMWDLNATKLNMINALRNYDGSFTMEFEDEDSVGMAEIAALASGDPLMLERVKLDAEIQKLELLERAHRRRQFGLDDQVAQAQRVIDEWPGFIAQEQKRSDLVKPEVDRVLREAGSRKVTINGTEYGNAAEAAMAVETARAAQQAGDENAAWAVNIDGNRFTAMATAEDAIADAMGDLHPFEATIGDKTYYRRARAARPVADKYAEFYSRWKDEGYSKTQSAKIGTMFGADLNLHFTPDNRGKSFDAELTLDKGDETIATVGLNYAVGGGNDGVPLAGARALLDKINSHAIAVGNYDPAFREKKIAEAKRDLPLLQEQKGKPFPQATEMREKRDRLQELITILAERTKKDQGGRASLLDAGRPLRTDPRSMATRARLERAITGIIQRVAGKHNVDIRFPDEIPAEPDPYWGELGRDISSAAGMYWGLKRMIEVALADPKFTQQESTAYHEAFHAVEDLLLTDEELQILRDADKFLRKVVKARFNVTQSQVDSLDETEVRAMAFQTYAMHRQQGEALGGLSGAIRRIFEKIRQALAQIRVALRGYKNAQEVFDAIYEGRMANRAAMPRWGVDYSGASPVASAKEPSRLADFIRGTVSAETLAPGDARWAAVQDSIRQHISAARRKIMAAAIDAGDLSKLDPAEQALIQKLQTVEPTATPMPQPAPAPTVIRLYRGEGGGAAAPKGQAAHAGSKMTGGWFTTDLAKAKKYGTVSYIDVTRDDMRHFIQGHGGPDEWVTDNPKFRARMKPLAASAPSPQQAAPPLPPSPPPPRGRGNAASPPPPPSRSPGARRQAQIDLTPEVLAERLAHRNMPKLARLSKKLLLGKANTVETRVMMQDKFLRWKRLQDDVIAQTGTPLPAEQDAYLAESLYYGRTGEQLEELDRETIDPIIKELQKRRISQADMDAFLYARHAPERNAALRQINEDIADPSGMSDEEAQRILDEVDASGKRADFDAVERMVRRMIGDTVQTLFDSGLLSDEEATAWAEAYQNYVPLRGWAEGIHEDDTSIPGKGRGFDIRGRESARAMGRRTLADSPLGYAMQQAQYAIVRAEKNRVGQAALEFVQAHPDPKLWTVDKSKSKRRIVNGQVVDGTDPRWKEADNVFAVKVDGEPHYITFKGEYGYNLARALKNLGTANMNSVIRFLGSLVRIKARMATSLNPEFMIPNFIRDIGEAFINLQENEQRGFVKAFAKHLPRAVGGSFQALAGYDGGRYAQAFREFDKAGGRIRFFGLENVEDVKRNIQHKMERLEGGAWNTTKDKARKAFEMIEIANGSIENATRLAAYMAARDVGLSEEKAASIAREMTVNFNRKGELGSLISSFYMFANAAIQGTTRAIGAMRNKRVRRFAYGLAATGAALALYNIAVGGDDDDGVPYYLKLAPWERDGNLVLMWPKGMGHDGQYVKLTLPYGYSFFHVIGARLASMFWSDKEDKAKATSAMAKSVLDAFDPLGKDENMLAQFLPTLAKPAAHLGMNQNWTGRPMWPEPMPWNKHQPDSSQTFRTTSEFSQGLASALNSATGGDKHTPGWLDFHPGAIDYWLNDIGGGTGRFAKNVVDTTVRAVRGQEWQPEKTPILRRFYGEKNDQADRGIYFDARDKVYAAHERDRGYEKDGDAEGRTRHAAKTEAERGAYDQFKRADEDRTRIRKEIDKVKEDSTLGAAERDRQVKELEREELDAMAVALSVYWDLKKPGSQK